MRWPARAHPPDSGTFRHGIESLAQYLHLNPEQVAKLAERGKLPGRRIAGRTLFFRNRRGERNVSPPTDFRRQATALTYDTKKPDAAPLTETGAFYSARDFRAQTNAVEKDTDSAWDMWVEANKTPEDTQRTDPRYARTGPGSLTELRTPRA